MYVCPIFGWLQYLVFVLQILRNNVNGLLIFFCLPTNAHIRDCLAIKRCCYCFYLCVVCVTNIFLLGCLVAICLSLFFCILTQIHSYAFRYSRLCSNVNCSVCPASCSFCFDVCLSYLFLTFFMHSCLHSCFSFFILHTCFLSFCYLRS